MKKTDKKDGPTNTRLGVNTDELQALVYTYKDRSHQAWLDGNDWLSEQYAATADFLRTELELHLSRQKKRRLRALCPPSLWQWIFPSTRRVVLNGA